MPLTSDKETILTEIFGELQPERDCSNCVNWYKFKSGNAGCVLKFDGEIRQSLTADTCLWYEVESYQDEF